MKLLLNTPTKIQIKSREPWNETGIEISSGEAYQFVAEGRWRDLLTPCNADGYTNWYIRLYDKKKRAREHNWFALIGSLDKTTDFLIGKQNTITFQQGGKLYCYANDAKLFYWNNSGQISLKITRIK